MFNLLRYFSLASAVALAVVTVVLVQLYRHDAVNELVESAESQNVTLARSFANVLWPRFSHYVGSVSGMDGDALRARPETRELDTVLKTLTTGLPVLKVKIYDLDGLTVYSSQPSQMGTDKSNNLGFLQSARDGKPASKLSYRDTFSAFSGTVENRDLVESYLPIWASDGAIAGVFELYTDVTPIMARIEHRTTELIAGLLLSFGLLYGILFLIVRYADRILGRQYSELKQAEEALRRAHDELETRVLERTSELRSEITERKQAEKALRQSEKRFKDIANSSADYFWERDENGRFAYISDRYQQVTGVDPKQILGKTREEVSKERNLPPEYEKEFLKFSPYHRERKSYRDISIKVLLPDGRVRYWRVTGWPVFDEEGEFRGYRGVISDITDEVRALEALREREALLAHAQQVAKVGYWVWYDAKISAWDLTGGRSAKRPLLSEQFREIFGICDSNVCLATRQVHPDDRVRCLEALRKADESHQTYKLEYRIIDDHGKIRFVHEIGEPRPDPKTGVRIWLGVVQDITERKRAEQALRESRDRIRLITDNLPAHISYLDTEQRFRFVNKTAQEWYARPAAAILGRTAGEIVGPKAHDQNKSYLEAALSGKEQRFELNRTYPDGITRAVEMAYVPHLNESGEVQGCFALVHDISERKRAEEMVRQLYSAIEVVAEPIALYDADDRIVFCNETYRALNTAVSETLEPGTSFEEHLRAIVFQGLMPEVKGREEEYVAQRMERHRNPRGPFAIARQEGIQLSVHEHKLPDGRTIVICADITERKRAEDALQKSEALFRSFIDNLPTEIFVRDTTGRFALVNRAWERVQGVSSQDVIGKTAYDIYPKDQADIYAAQDQAVLETGQALDRELEFREGSGSHFLHTIKFPISGADGEVTAIGGIAMDITERKRAEEALRVSEAQLKAIMDNAPAEIFLIDTDCRYVLVNREFERRYNVTAEEVKGLTVHDLFPEEIAQEFAAQDREVLDTRKGIVKEQQTPYAGAWHTDLELKFPIVDSAGAIVGLGAIGTDITERKHAEEEIRKLNAEMEQRVEERTAELRTAQADFLRQARMATLGQLTATVSHELRNPLGAIQTSNSVVRDNLKDCDPRVGRSLERIERSVMRCDRIIDELLDYTHIRQLELKPTPIDTWLEGVLEEQTLHTDITLRRDLSLPGVEVFLDQDRFRRAVINIFDNACQAMGGGGDGKIEEGEHILTIQTGKTNGRIEVVFEDNGHGIPPDVLPKIFEPMFSTKGFGVGLGLPVVKQIMEQHGGGIEIESEEGRGTWVCLWLPHGHSSH